MLSIHLWFRVDPLVGVNVRVNIFHETTINEWSEHIKRHRFLLTYQTSDHGTDTSRANEHQKCLLLLCVHIIIH